MNDDYTVKYFLSHPQLGEKEVTKEEYIRAERATGFRSKSGRDDVCATGGFSGNGISGSVRYINNDD